MADEKKSEEKKKEPEPTVNQTFYLVIVGDGPPQLIRCEDRASFQLAVQKAVLGAKEAIYAYGFMGQRVNITAPMPICAVEIDGETFKLGDDSPQFDETGKIVPLVRQEDDA